MNLSEFYKLALKFGIDKDPRKDKKNIRSFPDTAILYGLAETPVRRILVGIDIEIGEILLADRIRKDGGLDLVVAHHPEGKAWAIFYEVMALQVDLLRKIGMNKIEAAELLAERMREVERRVLPNNHSRAVDAARLLDIPLMCIHTPADNHVYDFLSRLLAKEKPRTAEDIVNLLQEIPEYKSAAKDNAGPRIILGSPKRPAGKVMLEMTGGTEGPKEVLEHYSKHGVRTIVCMHLSEEHFKKAKDANLNVVIAGHISSDNLGFNLLLDRIEKESGQAFELIECSGFRRFSRR